MGKLVWVALAGVTLLNYVIKKSLDDGGTLTQRVKSPNFREILWAFISPTFIFVAWFISATQIHWGSGDWATPAILFSVAWVVITKYLLKKSIPETIVLIAYSCATLL